MVRYVQTLAADMNMKATRKIQVDPQQVRLPASTLCLTDVMGWPRSSRAIKEQKSEPRNLCWVWAAAFEKEMKTGNTAVTQLWSNPDGMMWLCPLRILHEKEEEVDHKNQRRKEDVCWAERRIPSWCARRTFIWNQTVRSAHRHFLQCWTS